MEITLTPAVRGGVVCRPLLKFGDDFGRYVEGIDAADCVRDGGRCLDRQVISLDKADHELQAPKCGHFLVHACFPQGPVVRDASQATRLCQQKTKVILERQLASRRCRLREQLQARVDNLQAKLLAERLVELLDLLEKGQRNLNFAEVLRDQGQDAHIHQCEVDEHIGIDDQQPPRRRHLRHPRTRDVAHVSH